MHSLFPFFLHAWVDAIVNALLRTAMKNEKSKKKKKKKKKKAETPQKPKMSQLCK